VSDLRRRACSWLPFATAAVLWLLSLRALVSAWRHGVLFSVYSPFLYQAGTISFDALEFGPVRRGLAGAIAHLLATDRLVATVRFHVLFAALAAALAAWWLWRARRPLAERAVAALVVAMLMARWGEDAGRIDIAVAVLLMAAAVALLHRAPALAAAAISIGLGLHETAFIFGLPLLLALALDGGRWRSWSRGSIAATLGVLLVATAVYLALPALPHSGTRAMVEAVRAKLPRDVLVEWAIYFEVSGMRGVRTSVCENAIDPTFALHAACGVVLLGVVIELLHGTEGPRRATSWLAALPGFAFLDVVANDVSRWAMLAVLNAWLVWAVSAAERESAQAPSGVRWRALAAFALLPLTHPRVWPIPSPMFAPMPVVEHVWAALGGSRTLRFPEALQRCDPDWREVLGEGPP
jgi:hypothetical protein